jgi:type IV pilus assembly protein PilP
MIIACATVFACAPEMPKAKAPSAPSPSSVDEDAKAATEDAAVAPYIYSPVGKRDPFRDPATIRVAARPQGEGQVGPLQKFDLDQLRLSFTTTATSAPMALVIDPTGQGHIVQIGDFIGKNWGKISAIRREELTVMETIADPNTGRVYPQYIPMRMPKTDAESRADSTFSLKLSAEAGNP